MSRLMVPSAERSDRAAQGTPGHQQLSLGLVHGRDDVFAVGAEERLGDRTDTFAQAVDGVGDHGQFVGSGRRIGGSHRDNLFVRRRKRVAPRRQGGR